MTYVSSAQFYNPTLDGYDRSQTNNLAKDDFLNLLVTQLQYQNPLEPMQDQEFISQLAQFSQLEQLENMNGSLETNSQVNYLMSQTIANTMATTLIGKDVIAEGVDFVINEGDTADLSFELGADAAEATIDIYDEDGSLVRTVDLTDLPQGMNTYTWDGTDNSGQTVASGRYYIKATSDSKVATRPIMLLK